MEVAANRLQIGDTVNVNGVDRIVHALWVEANWIAVHFTDIGRSIEYRHEQRVTVSQFAPATDAEFAGL